MTYNQNTTISMTVVGFLATTVLKKKLSLKQHKYTNLISVLKFSDTFPCFLSSCSIQKDIGSELHNYGGSFLLYSKSVIFRNSKSAVDFFRHSIFFTYLFLSTLPLPPDLRLHLVSDKVPHTVSLGARAAQVGSSVGMH